jgi:hypothetical protein
MEGWVDKDKLETVEGDLQGLPRIRAHLGLELEEASLGTSQQRSICETTQESEYVIDPSFSRLG